ncbi:MAG: hypothetical protein JWN75_1207 [Candidatus Saccharibacteria bacterium]|nr:hypothetical protein [Candidatus Saccharibacteria bacterium]
MALIDLNLPLAPDPDPERSKRIVQEALIREGRAARRLGMPPDPPPFTDPDWAHWWCSGWGHENREITERETAGKLKGCILCGNQPSFHCTKTDLPGDHNRWQANATCSRSHGPKSFEHSHTIHVSTFAPTQEKATAVVIAGWNWRPNE